MGLRRTWVPWTKAQGCLRHQTRPRYPLAQVGMGQLLGRKVGSPDQGGSDELVRPCPTDTLGHCSWSPGGAKAKARSLCGCSGSTKGSRAAPWSLRDLGRHFTAIPQVPEPLGHRAQRKKTGREPARQNLQDSRGRRGGSPIPLQQVSNQSWHLPLRGVGQARILKPSWGKGAAPWGAGRTGRSGARALRWVVQTDRWTDSRGTR